MRKRALEVSGVILLAAVIVTFALRSLGRPPCHLVAGQNTVSVALSQLSPGSANFFCYRDHAGETIRFILARESDGAIRAALDACRTCFSYGKGYRAVRNAIVCRLCGNRYPINRMTRGEASCVPMKLAHREQGNAVQIAVKDLTEARRKLF